MKLTVGEKRPSDVQLVELTEEADMNLSSGTKVGDGRQPPAHLNGSVTAETGAMPADSE